MQDRDIAVNVVSKSGDNPGTGAGLPRFRKLIKDRYGRQGLQERIIATTDRERGVLREMATKEGFQTFVVPDDVGGEDSRF